MVLQNRRHPESKTCKNMDVWRLWNSGILWRKTLQRQNQLWFLVWFRRSLSRAIYRSRLEGKRSIYRTSYPTLEIPTFIHAEFPLKDGRDKTDKRCWRFFLHESSGRMLQETQHSKSFDTKIGDIQKNYENLQKNRFWLRKSELWYETFCMQFDMDP